MLVDPKFISGGSIVIIRSDGSVVPFELVLFLLLVVLLEFVVVVFLLVVVVFLLSSVVVVFLLEFFFFMSVVFLVFCELDIVRFFVIFVIRAKD